MGGTITSLGGRVGTTMFTESAHKPTRTWLAAAVLWRHTQPQLRTQREPLWRALWGLASSMMGRAPTFHSDWAPPAGWSGAGEGQGAVLYSREMQVVSVLGREFRLPPEGRALILLVDGDDSATATFTELSVESEPIPGIDVDRTQDRKVIAAQMAAAHRAQHEVLGRLIRSDPSASAFLDSE